MATAQVTPAKTTTKPTPAGSKRTTGKKDAISLLKADHAEVAALLKRFESAAEDEQGDLAGQICSALTTHATIEEEIFYPAAREALEGQDGEALLDEAAVEHDTLKYLIEQIHDTEDDGQLTARVTVLGEYVKHHVKEEETALFPKLKQTEMDMAAVGELLEGRKLELAAEEDLPGGDEDDDEDEEDEDDSDEDEDEDDEEA